MGDENSEPAKRKRKRVATPPPEDANCVGNEDQDFYDRKVTNVFYEIHSGAIDVQLDETEFITRQTNKSTAEPCHHESRKDMLSEHCIQTEPEEIVVMNTLAPSPPPPPLHAKQRRKSLNKDVKAALDKLRPDKMASETGQYGSPDYAEDVEQTAQADESLKVRIKAPSGSQRYLMKLTENFETIKVLFAEKEAVDKSRIIFFFGDRKIAEEDTVAQLGITFGDTVECLVLPEGDSVSGASTNQSAMFKIKVQGKYGIRDVEEIAIAPHEPLEILMKAFAAGKDLDVSDLTFLFDGEQISATDTPAELDMEDGVRIDVTGY